MGLLIDRSKTTGREIILAVVILMHYRINRRERLDLHLLKEIPMHAGRPKNSVQVLERWIWSRVK